jgi:hypothetical protein
MHGRVWQADGSPSRPSSDTPSIPTEEARAAGAGGAGVAARVMHGGLEGDDLLASSRPGLRQHGPAAGRGKVGRRLLRRLRVVDHGRFWRIVGGCCLPMADAHTTPTPQGIERHNRSRGVSSGFSCFWTSKTPHAQPPEPGNLRHPADTVFEPWGHAGRIGRASGFGRIAARQVLPCHRLGLHHPPGSEHSAASYPDNPESRSATPDKACGSRSSYENNSGILGQSQHKFVGDTADPTRPDPRRRRKCAPR